MAIHFLIQLSRGAQRCLSWYLGGAESILIHSHLIPCFTMHPKTTFMTTLLRSSVWRSQSTSLHTVRNNIDLRSKDLVVVTLENIWWHIQNNYPNNVSEWVNPTPCSLTCVHIINLISLYPWSGKCDHQLIHVLACVIIVPHNDID